MKLVLTLIFLLVVPVAAQAAPGDSASTVAQAWLALVDAGKYDASWDTASAFFQSKATKDQWAAIVTPVRDGVGALISRGPGQGTASDSMPGAPFAHYVTFRYSSKFAFKDHATETVIVMYHDGEWKVAGYFVY
jgi:hypothetical protein